ncbi:GMC oxidoreductase [Roseovarius sp.]|uniref:GMC oxidoreductase n=1 Tax=Roseovarius sp. TaxID=1486281 RepID=UPI0026290F00|nr:GMC family oxidoreductase [Roseovarius sp.]
MSADIRETLWDVIVIGAGMGGGIAGRRLAEMGLSVLFVEKGPSGHRAERQGLNPDMADPVARQLRGYWPGPMRATINGRSSEFFGPIGAGVGGSSVFYAATLERPERHDLEATRDRPHPTGGWPVGFDAMRPWYARAEALLHVCGETDPLSPEPPADLAKPPPLDPADSVLMASLTRAGLHPYRLHSAIRYLEGCHDCLGVKCPRPCKMDGRSAGVEPALATGHARVLDNCTVRRLRGDADRISHIEVLRDGEVFDLRARRFVLAAGAFGSPRLLLASRSAQWPKGCANESGLVGRHLMFHLNEIFALWPPRGAQAQGPGKAISLRDLYHVGGQRYGTVQAMGIDAGYGEIVHFLNGMFDRSGLRHIRVLRHLTRIPALIAARLMGRARVFVGLMEDLGYRENRVTWDEDAPDALDFTYQLHDELLARRRAFRRAISRGLRGHRRLFLTYQPELNFGHPCGTLRYGTDPKTSVLNADCRAHGVGNLYVADASFMPSSMGVNPSLTIAANALRVAEAIGQSLSKDTPE